MKLHLPYMLRCALLASLVLPVQAALLWNSGNWNTTDTSWLDNGNAAVFSQGAEVEFTAAATDKTVNITETVEPGSMVVSSSGYVFTGSGNISGAGALQLSEGAGLRVDNANAFTGGAVVNEGAQLTLTRYDSVGTVSAGESALGALSGGGMLELLLESPSASASVNGTSLQDFTGVVRISQGNLGLGRRSNHSGAGAQAVLNAGRVEVAAAGTFITSLGGGNASLNTGRSVTPDIRTVSGATLGNRDGHVNWTGDVALNLETLEGTTYDAAGTTQMSMYYGKHVVWNGAVSGAGTLELTSGVEDVGSDHRLVLANGGNTFNGIYRVNGAYLTTLALAAPGVADEAEVRLDTASSRLLLMNSSAAVRALNGSTGTVLAAGSGALVLSVQEGNFSGALMDAAGTTAGLSLGLTKTGSGVLNLVGDNCTYTGATTVQEGEIVFSGAVTLGSVFMEGASAQLSTGGNLTLRQGATLSFNMAQTAGPAISIGGGLNVSAMTHGVNVSGYESLALGSYELMSWSTASTVDSEHFYATGLNDTAEKAYSVQVQGNALQLVVGSMDDVPWLWSGGSAGWTDNSSAQWQNGAAGGPAGQVVTFGPRNDGTVTINRVTPAGIRVTGGRYQFTAASDAAEGIVSSGELMVSGDDTLLQVNLANPSFTGSTVLLGGTLEIGVENALGSSSLFFNGGQLRYGSGVTQDLSPQIHADSDALIRIDTNGNTVGWEDVDGVKQALSSGVEKNGAGELSLRWASTSDNHGGHLVVNEGTLSVTKATGQGTFSGGFSGSGTLVLSSPNGQLTVQGDNSAFAGTLYLPGDGSSNRGTVAFADGSTMGGSNTLVRVDGQRFWFLSNNVTTAVNMEIVEGSSTYMDGRAVGSYTFTGNFTGSGTLMLKPSSTITMSGDISGFTGQLQHPGSTNVTWLFGGEGVAGSGLVQADLNSPASGVVFTFRYSTPTTMSGVVSGAAVLRQSGSGALTLTGQSTGSGSLTIDPGTEVRLGSATTSAAWAGDAQLGTGRFTLVNGTLTNALSTIEGTLVADVAAGAVVDMGGMDANALSSISVAEGGRLEGIEGDLNIGSADGVGAMKLTLGSANVGNTAEGGAVVLDITGGNLVIHDAATVHLDMESIKSILQGRRQAVYLHITNTELELQNGVSADDLFAGSSTTPAALGLVVLGVEGGNVVLEGDVRDVYMVMQDGDYDTVTDYPRLQPYKATFVDSGYTLSLNLPGDNTQVAWVNNLLGSGDFHVSNTDEAAGVVRVLLNNAALGAVDSTLTPEQEEEIATANTLFEGNVSAGNAVQLVKTGSGTLTVGGALTADWLEIDEGTLWLTGQGNAINSLHGPGSLVLEGALEIAGNALDYAGALSGNGVLELNGALPGRGSVGALNGSGSLHSAGGTFTVQNVEDSSFTGALSTGDAPGVLSLRKGAGRFTMQQVQGSAGWTVQNAGNLVLNQAGDDANARLTLGGLELLDGSATTLILNTDAGNQVFSLSDLLVQDGAAVTLLSTGSLPMELQEDGTLVLGQVESADLGEDGRVPLTLGSGTPFRGIDAAWLSVENGLIIFNSWRDTSNLYAAAVSSANAQTGAQMLWDLPAAVLRESPDLNKLTEALDALVARGDKGTADRVMAAAAGASAAALGSALAGDMERQLKAIRNRTTSMGVDPSMVHEFPLFNAWVNAEGDRRQLDSSGTDAGYSLSSWGVTVGFDVDITNHFTAGLAFTAMYGDFQAESPDHAEGDLDTYYVTLFGRYAARRWTHTLVGAFGWADAELKRRVDYGSGSYSTRGSSDGMSFGMLYELGYVIPLDEDATSCLQPIVNISYRHVGLDAYDESGSDAGLHVGRQDMDVVTFGLGARAQTYALENLYNRSCLLEGRVLFKLDAGDTRSHSSVALLADRGRGGRVRSAETGRFGVEMGAGMAIPLGADSGSVFLDAGVELRSREYEVNGTVGYRLSF